MKDIMERGVKYTGECPVCGQRANVDKHGWMLKHTAAPEHMPHGEKRYGCYGWGQGAISVTLQPREEKAR